MQCFSVSVALYDGDRPQTVEEYIERIVRAIVHQFRLLWCDIATEKVATMVAAMKIDGCYNENKRFLG